MKMGSTLEHTHSDCYSSVLANVLLTKGSEKAGQLDHNLTKKEFQRNYLDKISSCVGVAPLPYRFEQN